MKVCLITGAGSGIGLATVREFHKNGYAVLACDVAINPDTFKGLTNVVALKLDVTDEHAVAKAVELAASKWGALDCAFANAGISGSPSLFTDCETDEFDQILKVNVLGVFYVWKYATLMMQKLKTQNGVLLSTASVAGIRSGAGGTAYSASKAAVINMTQVIFLCCRAKSPRFSVVELLC